MRKHEIRKTGELLIADREKLIAGYRRDIAYWQKRINDPPEFQVPERIRSLEGAIAETEVEIATIRQKLAEL